MQDVRWVRSHEQVSRFGSDRIGSDRIGWHDLDISKTTDSRQESGERTGTSRMSDKKQFVPPISWN